MTHCALERYKNDKIGWRARASHVTLYSLNHSAPTHCDFFKALVADQGERLEHQEHREHEEDRLPAQQENLNKSSREKKSE